MAPARILFPVDPLEERGPDPAYAAEHEAARAAGLACSAIDHDAIAGGGEAGDAVRRVRAGETGELGIYRGWMMTPDAYGRFHAAVGRRGVRLINSPEEFLHCHHFPESYPVIEGRTPRSAWMEVRGEPRWPEVMDLLRPFGSRPVIVKDFVKSRKHEWAEACYIPSAADRAAVERVAGKFVELQGEDLAGGLVFREFVEFEPLARHSKSGMPLTKEFRLFYLNGRLLSWFPYWEEGEYGSLTPPVDEFADLARRIRSRFFTMDIAKRAGGEWMVVELGDGQVAGLPGTADPGLFYRALAAGAADLGGTPP